MPNATQGSYMQSRLQKYPWEHCKYCRPLVSNSWDLPISRFRALQTVTGVGFSYFFWFDGIGPFPCLSLE